MSKRRSQLGSSLALVPLLASAACAAQQPRPEVFWPPPPETPRVRFESAVFSSADLPRPLGARLVDLLTGSTPRTRIAQPTGVALSPDEKRLVVTSAAYSSIVVVDFADSRVRPCEIRGPMPARPFAVALDAGGDIYVTDQAGPAVVVLDGDCTTIRRRFGERIFVRPTGIAVDRGRGLVYVLDGGTRDSEHHTLEVFTTAGEHVRTIGRRGNGDGELFFPVGVAVGARGQVAVTDTMNFRVQLFDPEGRFVAKFGQPGAGYGAFGRLKGVAFDSFDNLHVVDGEFALVQVFNSRNEPLMRYGTRAPFVEYMDMPTAIAIGAQNEIYVTDFSVGAVKKYRLINTTKEESSLPLAEPATPSPAAEPASVSELQ